MKIRVQKAYGDDGMLWSTLSRIHGASLKELDVYIRPDVDTEDTAVTVGDKINGLSLISFITPPEATPFSVEIRSFGKDPDSGDDRVYVRLVGLAGGFEKVEAQAEGTKFYVSGLPSGAVVSNQDNDGKPKPRVLFIML